MVVAHDPAPLTALQTAIDRFGGQSALARHIGVSQQSVSKWVRRRKPLPPEHVIAVETATGISRHDLRPDIYPRETPEADRADLEPAR